jgi:thioredoxin-related protein
MQRTAIFLLALLALPLAADPEYPKMGPDIYDPKADGTAQITAALEKAGGEKKRVLLMFGANWCPWCRRLHRTLTTDAAVAKTLRENYELVLVDMNTRHDRQRNAAVNERYGNPLQHGLPVFVVLDAGGKRLTTRETATLEDERGRHSAERVLAFLEQWKPKDK